MWRNRSEGTSERLLAFGLVTTGALAARLAIAEPGTPWYLPILVIAAHVVVAGLLARSDAQSFWLTRRVAGRFVLTWWGILLSLVLLVAPLLDFTVRLLASLDFRPLEQVAIIALTNFAFFATALGRLPRNNATAVGIGSMLLLAALMIGEHQAITPLAAMFGGLSVAWLAMHHWQQACVSSRDARIRRMPLIPVFGLMLALAGITAGATRFAHGIPETWGEWAPSSGGSSGNNPRALLGIGSDGESVTGGPQAKSTGPVDADYFLESDLPSLWDVFTDTYGEPRKPRDVQRAISASPEQMLKNDGHKAPNIGKAGREFSLYRKSRAKEPPQSDDASALLYVEGRAPLHLALAAYDSFDGISWHEPPETRAVCRVASNNTDPWLWLPNNPLDVFGATRTYAFRFGLLKTERVPIPNHLERFRLGRKNADAVKRWARDVLIWAYEGILQSRQCLPPGTVLEIAVQRIDRTQLARADELLTGDAQDDAWLQVPEHLRPSTDVFAAQFNRMPRGWSQIDAVLDHLRTHYAHDRNATLPQDCPDPIHHFLEQARGGPAYQFATAATLALRRMGYPTRVVSGFYVDPDDYVARAGHTAIQTDDAHVWIEVRTVNGAWITLDPTPGYETAWYRPTFWESLKLLGASLIAPVVGHPFRTMAGVILGFVLWSCRLRLWERLLTVWCQWSPIDATARLAATLELLDLRSRLAGQGRPPSRTPQAWYQGVDAPAMRPFIRDLYRAMYGGCAPREVADREEVKRVCQAVVRAARTSCLRPHSDPT